MVATIPSQKPLAHLEYFRVWLWLPCVGGCSVCRGGGRVALLPLLMLVWGWGWGIICSTGGIAVSRSFGDVSMKVPGYVSAQAEFTQYQIGAEDQFIVLACDGLWDVFSNQEVVDIVLAVWVCLLCTHSNVLIYTHSLSHTHTHTHTHTHAPAPKHPSPIVRMILLLLLWWWLWWL